MRGVDGVRSGPAIQSAFHGAGASRREGEQGDASPLCSAETSASCKTRPAGDGATCVGPHAVVFGCRETNRKVRFSGVLEYAGTQETAAQAILELRFSAERGGIRPGGAFRVPGYAGGLATPAWLVQLVELRVISEQRSSFAGRRRTGFPQQAGPREPGGGVRALPGQGMFRAWQGG